MADILAEVYFPSDVDTLSEGSNADHLTRELETVEIMSYLMLALGMIALTTLGLLRAPYGAFSSDAALLCTRSDQSQLFKSFLRTMQLYIYLRQGLSEMFCWPSQECPSALLPVAIMWTGGDSLMTEMDMKAKVLGAAFLAHYVHRAFLFPLALRPSSRTPAIVSILAFMFTTLNALLQVSMWLQHQHWHRVDAGQFWAGMTVWVLGACTNVHADYHLIQLKRTAPSTPNTRCQIPYRGIFNYVSGGSYLAEIIEWLGYCIAANHIAALAFLCFVICNIGPRAFHYHHMYLQLFPDYPKTRKALIPWLL